jgi:phospholipid transport system substrate-binding protein
MNRRASIFSVSLLIALPTLAGSAVAGGTSPEEVIRTTAANVIEVLADKARTTAQKKATLDGYLDTCCDFLTISKLVLAKNWKSFSEPQQAEFTSLFRKYLIATYGDNIENYAGETVQVLSGRKEARDDYTVMTKVARGGGQADILVDYRLRKAANGEWKIIDVIAEGISLVANLRSQFQDVITRGGTEALLAQLREKTSGASARGTNSLAVGPSGA